MSEHELQAEIDRLTAEVATLKAERDDARREIATWMAQRCSGLLAEIAALKAERQAADESLRDAHLLIMLLRTHIVEIVDHGDFMVAMGYEPSGHATLHERHIRAFNAARVSVAGEDAQR